MRPSVHPSGRDAIMSRILQRLIDTHRAELAGLAWVTPPEDQGQMIEQSYAWDGPYLWRRTVDRSARPEDPHRVTYSLADEGAAAEIPDDWHACNAAPPIPERAWDHPI